MHMPTLEGGRAIPFGGSWSTDPVVGLQGSAEFLLLEPPLLPPAWVLHAVSGLSFGLWPGNCTLKPWNYIGVTTSRMAACTPKVLVWSL